MKLFYPGTFDPLTRGHMNMIRRGSEFADELIVGVAQKPSRKEPLLSVEQRVELMRIAVKDLGNVRVVSYEGPGLDKALELRCEGTLRGIRNGEDFDYEQEYAQANCEAQPEQGKMETIFLATCTKHGQTSSSYVRSLMRAGKNAEWEYLVPLQCIEYLRAVVGKYTN